MPKGALTHRLRTAVLQNFPMVNAINQHCFNCYTETKCQHSVGPTSSLNILGIIGKEMRQFSFRFSLLTPPASSMPTATQLTFRKAEINTV